MTGCLRKDYRCVITRNKKPSRSLFFPGWELHEKTAPGSKLLTHEDAIGDDGLRTGAKMYSFCYAGVTGRLSQG